MPGAMTTTMDMSGWKMKGEFTLGKKRGRREQSLVRACTPVPLPLHEWVQAQTDKDTYIVPQATSILKMSHKFRTYLLILELRKLAFSIQSIAS